MSPTALLLALWTAEALLDLVLNRLNVRALPHRVPAELAGTLDEATTTRTRAYLREASHLALVRRLCVWTAWVGFTVLGGFERLDGAARSWGFSQLGAGIAFLASASALQWLVGIPFSLASTFGLEQRYGFNRTTPRLWLADQLRGLLLAALLGLPLLAGVLALFQAGGWLWAWLLYTGFGLLMSFVAPVLLLPLFNRFTPVAEGELLDRIRAYVAAQDFPLRGVFVMDSSRRSTRSNAFFTGFGRFRRLVLFDTLIERQTPRETLAVVAHEIGHFRLHHIPLSLALGTVSSLAGFWGAGWAASQGVFSNALGLTTPSVAANLLAFSLALAAGLRFLSLLPNWLSRKHEYDADAWSVRTTGDAEAMAQALLKLHHDNFSHPAPHWLKVAFDYTHPPLIARLRALRAGPC